MIRKRKKLIACLLIGLLSISLMPRQNVFAESFVPKQNETDIQQSIDKFGPYRGTDKSQGHAYEPFKEKEEEHQKTQNLNFRKDRILIKMDNSLDTSTSLYSSSLNEGGQVLINSLNEKLLKNHGIANIKPIFKEKNEKSFSLQESYGSETGKSSIWYTASLSEGSDVVKTIEDVKNIPNVIMAEPDYIRNTSDLGIPTIVTDPKMGEQWYLDRLGIKEAWNYLKDNNINSGGNRNIVVAVIDTGVDYTHPDLAANMWTNTGEIPNNNIDDDNNGFTDDIHGASTVSNSWAGQSGDPMDDNGHGTHVAGIIAAASNNDEGGAGIAHNVQIMAIKAAQSSGVLTSSDIAQAIRYAADKGADVINMSFGGYNYSTVEEDALQVAFGTSVLVASAGNDDKPNLLHPLGRDMYPAAYPWVLGVMAEGEEPAYNGDNLADFSNWDYKPQDSHEYEVMAPGVDIFSTLPNGKYAKWDGTSMAAPVVSAIAALVRSKFSDKDSYSSRFVMGQVASTGPMKQGITYDDKKPPIMYHEVNAFEALTNTPKPKLSYIEHYIFDKKNISEGNDEDGVVDAGETFDIGMVIRNHWGKADNVQVTMDTKSSAGIADPYVSFVTDTVDYGAVGNFAIDDNGFIYEKDVVTGVNHPFRIKVAENTPNDHIVPINITLTCKNGFDPNDSTVYTFGSKISFAVRNGVDLPSVISQDMTLTKDKYWIVPNATLIEKGVTVKVEPGTQIQFWSSEPEDPYAEKPLAYLEVRGNFLVNGTAKEPVEMFASGLYPGYEVKIYGANIDGQVQKSNIEINYAKIMNPNIYGANKIDHCYFSQDLFDKIYRRELYNGIVQTYEHYGPLVNAKEIANTKFYKLGSRMYDTDTSRMLQISGISKGNLFDSCVYQMDEQYAQDNVYLKNYKLSEQQYGDRTYMVSQGNGFGFSYNKDNVFQSIFPVKYNDNGSTYLAVKSNMPYTGYEEMKTVEKYAQELGGHIVTINNVEENNFIYSYIGNYVRNENLFKSTYPNLNYNDFNYYGSIKYIIGLNDFEEEGNFKWISGDSSDYTNWYSEEPNNKYSSYNNSANFTSLNPYNGTWEDYIEEEGGYNRVYIVEVPGISYVRGITLNYTNLTLGAGGESVNLISTIFPEKANNKVITWESSNPEVAAVDENGIVTPLTIGSTTIKATTEDGGYIANCEVSIIQTVHPTGVIIDKASFELPIGTNEKLNATISPAGATNRGLLWKSSNEEVATVDSNGVVTALKEGNTSITVTTLDGGYTAQCIVSVVVPVSALKLENEFLRLVIGDEATKINAFVEPVNATNKNITWSSSNKDIVEVDIYGNVKPISQGTALITAITENGAFKAECIVTVWSERVSFKSTQISAAYNYSMAINEDGTLWSWGYNDYGNLGDGTTIKRTSPVKVKNISEVIQVSAGPNHTAALKNDGTVWTWGYNGDNCLGHYNNNYLPNKVDGINDVKDVCVGSYYTVALKNDGTVWSWGNNQYGQLGDGSNSNKSEPVQVQNLTEVIAISIGTNNTVALKKDGTVWSWGNNDNGQLGDGTNISRNTPMQVKGVSNITKIAAGQMHAVALKEDGTVWTWGWNGYGVLGNRNTQGNLPGCVQNIQDVMDVSAGYGHITILKKDGTVWTWGYNEYGQLGNGNYETTAYTLFQAKYLKDVVAISSRNNYTLALKSDGTVWAFGDNQYGQLGNLTTERSNVPVQSLFGILPDEEAPTIVSTTPENNSSSIASDVAISINFSEAVKKGDNFGLIKLRDSSSNTLSLKEASIIGNVLTIKPISKLQQNMTYTLRIPSNAVKDYFNNNLITEYILSFTTGLDGALSSKINEVSSMQNIQLYSYGGSNDPKEATITEEDIKATRDKIMNDGSLSTIRNNAILNRWWDSNVNTWMRFTSGNGQGYRELSSNYWGTTSEILIGKALIDFNDFRNMEEIKHNSILMDAPVTAYPFVTDVYVSTEIEERATKVGAESIKVHVLFNRDMSTEIQPQVNFGPDIPTTDYTVHAIDGGWASPREWIGTMKITSTTGDGYQFFRVAGAVAADDPWLVTGNDSERFRFEIITSGTEAMKLQATGEEGKIVLDWTQDDFETLAGYNIYRSEDYNMQNPGNEGSTGEGTGTFVKINTAIIPADVKTFDDTEVQPGKVYYYKFKVVKTDLNESEFSNVASAAAVDTIAPVINHEAIRGAAAGMPLQVYADVTDNLKVSKVTLYYRKNGESIYVQKEMLNIREDRYSTTLEASFIQAPGIEYYIEATDGISIVRNGRSDAPNKVVITDAPKITSITPSQGSEQGGTKVIITGANFKEGATVKFDGIAATAVVVESINRIAAVTPAHYPAVVDLTVTNPNGYKDTYIHAFNFIKEGVEVTINDANANIGQIFEVPINVANVSGLLAVDLALNYDKDILKVKDVRCGNLTSSFSVQFNNTPGNLMLSMVSANAVSGTGTLVFVEFEVLNSVKMSSALTFGEVKLNSGNILVSKVNGAFNISDTHVVNGRVYYYSNYSNVKDVEVKLNGNKIYTTTTNSYGNYSLRNIEKDSYTVEINKSNEDYGISPYDASLIMQYLTKSTELTTYQKIAADVNSDGKIDSMDASYVLQKSVGLIEGPFSGTGKSWKFDYSNTNYNDLNSDYYNQDIRAILVGDVTGNWGSYNNENIASTSSKAEFKLGASQINADSTTTVPVIIDMAEGKFYGTTIEFDYDPSLAGKIQVEKTELAKDFAIAVNTNAPGKIRIALAGASPIIGKGKILNIKFSTNINSVVDINITNVNVNEDTVQSIIYSLGDVNRDGFVNINDLNDAGNNINATTDENNAIYDANGDGVIDIFDLVIISKKIKP